MVNIHTLYKKFMCILLSSYFFSNQTLLKGMNLFFSDCLIISRTSLKLDVWMNRYGNVNWGLANKWILEWAGIKNNFLKKANPSKNILIRENKYLKKILPCNTNNKVSEVC